MARVNLLPGEALFGQPLPLWKRGIDIAGSLAGLILLSPIFLLMALYIKCVSPGSVFFPQTRVGYLGREFRFWKFRTMHVNNDTESHRQYMTALIGTKRNEAKPMEKTEEVSRIIPFGRFIRKSCVDELPQLYNVLIGDMSLIGPRPAIPYEVDAYQRWHSSRFDTIPGMTGLWQVSGKNRLSFQEMVSLDIRYLRDLSLRQDARILARTIPAILDQIRAKTRKGK